MQIRAALSVVFAENAAGIKAHAALGGRLVHGYQSTPNQSGGAVVPSRPAAR